MKLKKLSACLLAVSIAAFSAPAGAAALAAEEVKAPSAVLMEANTGKILFQKNPHEKRACASITKIMTLLLVMEALDSGKIGLTDKVSVSEHAASMGGSQIWLKPGETMTVDDMLKACVIASANDASVVLGEYVAGSEEEFVSQMNQRAKALKMNDTTFKNCYGLDEEGHLSSAYDIALMSRELVKHKKIFNYTKTWMDYLRGGKTQLVNTNKLLKTYRGITGLKTGTTSQAGSCISATAERNGVSLIAVVLGCSDTKTRFASAASLLDSGFANWSVARPALPKEAGAPVPVRSGMAPMVEADVESGGSILVPKGKAGGVKYQVTRQQSVTAPVKKGQVLGKVTCTLDGSVLQEYSIRAKTSVEELTFGAVFRLLARGLLMAA
ncbi:MAG TPA: D-alanyl-D-alanine carboxypeptidase [Ruminococcaceae bacterium]|jgi:D-alanyl-D-alanine carboxypeptidase (penicillin-binding protein 5/6)|nr:D-alanyl-D-alanine carboxypeptidase [Oscillospiraceae bacterium]HBQ47059.1 D-alanyl-D-alanine carboxypeptidase [Oscillospiraceae bacterium]HBT90989.1 D-alanyl-D-alanine carboxypeptidase [Oscillospiraceae bacterium]HCB91442.1 D-alanyl-D-alanine carboxypeptidase [Oscillospiraceae bacterium]